MPRWTTQDLEAYETRRAQAGTKVRPAEPEQDATPALVKTETGKLENPPRIGVRIGIYRSRICDLDNAWGGSKAITDCLCAIGLLPGDSPSQIDLNVQQTYVRTKKEEKTVVEITYP